MITTREPKLSYPRPKLSLQPLVPLMAYSVAFLPATVHASCISPKSINGHLCFCLDKR